MEASTTMEAEDTVSLMSEDVTPPAAAAKFDLYVACAMESKLSIVASSVAITFTSTNTREPGARGGGSRGGHVGGGGDAGRIGENAGGGNAGGAGAVGEGLRGLRVEEDGD